MLTGPVACLKLELQPLGALVPLAPPIEVVALVRKRFFFLLNLWFLAHERNAIILPLLCLAERP